MALKKLLVIVILKVCSCNEFMCELQPQWCFV